MMKMLAHIVRDAVVLGLFVIAAQSLMTAQSLLERAQRVNDIYDVERFHNVYAYQQDNLLFEDQGDLFSSRPGVEAHFQYGVFEGKEGARRLWTGHWGGFSNFAFMPVYGVLIDHRQAQPVIDISPDGQSAKLRGRTSTDDTAQHRTAMKDPKSTTGHEQSVIYENELVKEDGIWKLKVFRLCVYAEGPMGTGYADFPPVPGKHGNGAPVAGSASVLPPVASVVNVPTHDREGSPALHHDVPERDMSLFPGNETGPDRMETPEQYGCFVAKDQTMIHSLLVPFHYPNPVTGKPVTWVNK